jgi:molecular chaperone GrpE
MSKEEKEEKVQELVEPLIVKPKIEDKEQECIERLQRLQAEFENFQKRTEKEKKENLINANADLIYQLLEVLDNFELSLKHSREKGVRMIYENFKKILKKQGLKIIDTSGDFNPEIHEVLVKEEGEGKNVILEEFQKGYMLNDKLLRASKVKIGKVEEKK